MSDERADVHRLLRAQRLEDFRVRRRDEADRGQPTCIEVGLQVLDDLQKPQRVEDGHGLRGGSDEWRGFVIGIDRQPPPFGPSTKVVGTFTRPSLSTRYDWIDAAALVGRQTSSLAAGLKAPFFGSCRSRMVEE